MGKLVGKGIARDNTYIALRFQCTNGVDTYAKRFLIKEEHNIFTGYGCYVRTADFFITIKGVKYGCYYTDGKTISLFCKEGIGELDGVCYIVKQ